MPDLKPYKDDKGLGTIGNFINGLLNNFLSGGYFSSVNVFQFSTIEVKMRETENEYIVEGYLPGMTKDEICIKYVDNYITITAKKNSFTENKANNYYSQQSCHEVLNKSFHAENVDVNKINGSLENGVLKLILPKLSGKKIQEEKERKRIPDKTKAQNSLIKK